MQSMFDADVRAGVVHRIRSLTPDTNRRWGRMSAPQMIAHLTDQMTHTLGDVPVAGALRDLDRRDVAVAQRPNHGSA